MNTPIKVCLASALALATALPAIAQDYSGSPYRPTQQYQDDQARYKNDRAAYEAKRDAYDNSRAAYDDRSADYRAARADYDRRRADWVRARADYDARYGYGAYVRVYGPEPVWDEARWSYVAPAPAAGYYGRESAYTTTNVACRPANKNNAVAGGIIGALAGAALGSNVAANGRGTEGAVLGAVVGGALGASVGNAKDKYRCDQRGPYYSYSNTIAYHEDRRVRSGDRQYADYTRMRCRLAAAPIDTYGRDYRYVRVCPDTRGRYRITG